MRLFSLSSGGFAYYFISATAIPYLSSCCFYIRACCKNFQWILSQCDEIISTKYDNKDVQIKAITLMLKNAVTFHMRIIKCVRYLYHNMTNYVNNLTIVFIMLLLDFLQTEFLNWWRGLLAARYSLFWYRIPY